MTLLYLLQLSVNLLVWLCLGPFLKNTIQRKTKVFTIGKEGIFKMNPDQPQFEKYWRKRILQETAQDEKTVKKTIEHDNQCENSRGWDEFPCGCEERSKDK